MRGYRLLTLSMPVMLAAALSACASGGVQPGIVSRSGPSAGYAQGPSYANQAYGNQPNQAYGNQTYVPNRGYVQNASANGAVAGTTPLDPNDPANAAYGSRSAAQPQPAAGAPGDSGRVVSINDVSLQGSPGGMGNGTMVGGLLGGAGGATLGAVTGHTLGSGIVGGLLGAVGGAIIGTIFDGNHGAGGRGIEVTVQRNDGSKVTVAQQDTGDIQLGDRVQIVQGRNGAAQVVRDTSRNPD
jgi:outer membrane lipoprotein SlyB